MTYKLNKMDDPKSCIERQAETIRSYQQEINRLRQIVDKKTEAMDRAVKQITNCRESRRELFNENSDLKERIRKLERRQPVVLREDANWDSRPREERSDESHIEITEQGICAINGEDPNKQVKFCHDGGESTIIVTDDNWESSETLYKG